MCVCVCVCVHAHVYVYVLVGQYTTNEISFACVFFFFFFFYHYQLWPQSSSIIQAPIQNTVTMWFSLRSTENQSENTKHLCSYLGHSKTAAVWRFAFSLVDILYSAMNSLRQTCSVYLRTTETHSTALQWRHDRGTPYIQTLRVEAIIDTFSE